MLGERSVRSLRCPRKRMSEDFEFRWWSGCRKGQDKIWQGENNFGGHGGGGREKGLRVWDNPHGLPLVGVMCLLGPDRRRRDYADGKVMSLGVCGVPGPPGSYPLDSHRSFLRGNLPSKYLGATFDGMFPLRPIKCCFQRDSELPGRWPRSECSTGWQEAFLRCT